MTLLSSRTCVLSILAVAGLAACTTAPQKVMDMPANFQAQSDKLRIKGARTWKLWGKISLADDVAGKYQRRASTSTWFDTFETKKAKAKFDVSVRGEQVQSKCTMKQKKIYLRGRSFGVITKYVTPTLIQSPMKYVCEFDGANIPANASLVLAQAQSNNLRPFGQDEVKRFGYMDWDGVTLEFESGHRFQGALPSFLEDFTPSMGYFIYEGPDMVGVIDLEGKQFLYIEPGVSDETRKAVMIATMALVLHTDPAE